MKRRLVAFPQEAVDPYICQNYQVKNYKNCNIGDRTVNKCVQFLNVPKGCADGFKGFKSAGSQVMLMNWWGMGRG